MKTLALADRTRHIRPSPTLALTAKARAMRAEGKDVISMSVGEPDFNTPPEVCAAAIEAIRAGDTKYTASSGTPALREAICRKLNRDHGIAATPDRVVASCGAKHSVYNALQAVVDPGDEVILIAPYWMTYYDQVILAGGRPVVIHTTADTEFVPTRDQLEAAVTSATKAIILNSPSNPTGATMPRETLQAIAEISDRRGLWVISDEIYERLVYVGTHQSMASLGGDVLERTIFVSGCSKTYAMTGWRVGYLYAPLPVAKAISTIQDQVTSNPTSFAQAGAIAALDLPESAVDTMIHEFAERRALILDLLATIPRLQTHPPQGAFYVFPDVSAYLGGDVADDVALCDRLLERALVATVPGTVFEGPGHLRISYAASRTAIQTAVERIGNALNQIATA